MSTIASFSLSKKVQKFFSSIPKSRKSTTLNMILEQHITKLQDSELSLLIDDELELETKLNDLLRKIRPMVLERQAIERSLEEVKKRIEERKKQLKERK